MKIEIYEKFMKLATVAILILGILLILKVLDKRDQKIMSVKYCFEELADGSLYHYVCEE